VDPSSPFTGGALLGDRVRMDEHGSREDMLREAGAAGRVLIVDDDRVVHESGAIIDYIVRKHGGAITLESEEGNGSNFIIRIPKANG